MGKPVLFLLKPGFFDDKGGPFFCPDCAVVEGFLTYAPEVVDRLDIRRIDSPRPRKAIVDLIGVANQGCPVLVLDDAHGLPVEGYRSEETGRIFICGNTRICEFLGRTFGAVRPHP